MVGTSHGRSFGACVDQCIRSIDKAKLVQQDESTLGGHLMKLNSYCISSVKLDRILLVPSVFLVVYSFISLSDCKQYHSKMLHLRVFFPNEVNFVWALTFQSVILAHLKQFVCFVHKVYEFIYFNDFNLGFKQTACYPYCN